MCVNLVSRLNNFSLHVIMAIGKIFFSTMKGGGGGVLFKKHSLKVREVHDPIIQE